MCRRTRSIAAAFGAVAAIASPSAGQTLDDAEAQVTAYLDGVGAMGLLAFQLEARLDAAPKDRQPEIGERLAGVYEALLGRAGDPDEQREWERRSERLLETLNERQSAGLRLSLARAAYDRLEGVLRGWRLRTLDETGEAGMPDVVKRFEELEHRLSDLAQDAHQQVRLFERQEESGRDFNLDVVDDAVESARRQRSLAHYLAGWCAYHVAEVTGSSDRARRAMEHFGWLLNARQGASPEIDRLPEQLLRYEHVARSVLAVALCESLRGRTAQALDWLAELERADELAPGVAEQLFSVRQIILSRGGRWTELEELVGLRRAERPLGVGAARLLAVAALEAEVRTPGERLVVERLRGVAIGELVASGQLAQVLDLSRRYDIDTGSAGSFLTLFVRGLKRFEAARTALAASVDGGGGPTRSPEIARTYADAAGSLSGALDADDAERYAAVHGQVAHLLATSLYHASVAGDEALASIGVADPLTASADWFERAAALLTDVRHVAGARWMIVRALDARLRRPGVTKAMVDRRRRAAELFLERHPDDDRAAALVLQRASDQAPTEAVLVQLLGVAEDSALHDSARRRAARVAYDLYRAAGASDRAWQAARYVELAEPLLAADRRTAARGDAEAAELAIARARRLVEVILASEPPDLARAERTLDVIVSLASAGEAVDEAVEAELVYRRAQIALVRGDVGEAERLVDELRAAWPARAGSAARLFYNHALRQWRQGRRLGRGDADMLAHAAAVAKHGRHVLEDLAASPGADPAVERTVRVNVAEALLEVWRRSSDDGALGEALERHRRLVAAFPRDRRALEGPGEAAAARGAHEEALEAWRRLIAGASSGEPAWFGYRVRIVESLQAIDRSRALEVLEQHAVLFPSWGPSPWGPRLRELHEGLTGGGGR